MSSHQSRAACQERKNLMGFARKLCHLQINVDNTGGTLKR